MKLFKLIFLIHFLLVGNFTISQVNLDSLFSVWNDINQKDSSRLKAIYKIADGYLSYNPDSAFYFAQMHYDFAMKVDDKKSMAKALNTQGISFYNKRNYEKTIDYYEDRLKILEELGKKKEMGSSYNDIGIIYNNLGNYEKSLEYHEKSLKIREEIDDKKGMGSSYNNIGNVYSNQVNYEKSLEYHEKSLKIVEEIGFKRGMGSSYVNIGNNYADQGNYEKSLEYTLQAKKIFEEIGDKRGMGICNNNIGSIYNYQGNYEKSLEYYEKSLKIREEIDDKKGMGSSYKNIGNNYADQGNYEKSLEFLLKSKKIFEEINVITDLDETAKILVEVYEKLGKPQKALENYKLYVIINDSLSTMDGKEKEKQRQYHEQYVLEKQADSIKHADEIILHQAEAKNQKQRSNGLILISIIILVSLVLVITQLKKIKKGKLVVEERNIVIEEKQKEITDSINYAKRLQDGILVPFDLVQSWLSESFILFKPKDIVSGDFYWIEKVGDKIYFAVADCTGHGIPGALVSIICSNALSKSLQEDKISSPAKILDATRKLVEERFVRAADNIKDGMDISLCCLNVKSKIITWSGAMNQLWIVKKDAKEIQELKPDRQAIGMVENPKPFTEHKIKLVVGDSIYLFSDGYIDQFGGPKGKKYMKGKMKKFVLSLQNQSMKEQLVSFDKEFNSWKGNRDQIDDVCVMGVRIT